MRLSKELNFICFFLVLCFVNSQHQQQQKQSHQQRHHTRKVQQQVRTRRIYAMCPPSFTKIGSECYHLSSSKASWLDSHFECKDKNAKLAEPLKYSDRFLRKYLLQRGTTRGEIWIGGMYNWQRHKWQWGYNGKDMTYQSFSQMKPGEDLKYNCAVLNPELKYRWSAKLCFEKHYYLCQHRMPYVSEKNRQRIYTKWNETFPGQMANEMEVYVPQANANRRRVQQKTGSFSIQRQRQEKEVKKSQTSLRNQKNLRNNQLPVDTRLNNHYRNNEINPPEVLSTQDSQLRRKKQQQKERSKENRTIILSGNIDLGENILRKSKQQLLVNRKKPNLKSAATSSPSPSFYTTTIIPTTLYPKTTSGNYHTSNHRYNSDVENTLWENNEKQRVADEYLQTTTTRNLDFSHQQQAFNSTLNSATTRQIEKKKRLENIREKLSKLSDEEKMEYLKIKAQRKAQRGSKSINDTIP